MRYNIRRDHPFMGTIVELDVLPTPRLISEGTRHSVEAYRESEWTPAPGATTQGIWRVRDDSYDPPGTEYQRVRVEVEEAPDLWS